MVANHLAPCPPLRPNPLSDDASRASSSSSSLLSSLLSSPSPSLSLSPSPSSPLPHSTPLSRCLLHHLSPTFQSPAPSPSPVPSPSPTLLTSQPLPLVPYRLSP